jgi:hypothetical protein
MAKLYLKFEETVLKEVPLSEGVTTIGRLPDNTLQIDNLAVSGHHCRIYLEGDKYFVEDSNSLNGTYVNQQRVNKSPLNDDDEVLIGKHIVQFKVEVAAQVGNNGSRPEPATTNNPAVLVMKDSHARGVETARAETISVASPPRKQVGVLSVLEGKTDDQSYVLTGGLTVIGKSDMASIRLKGWFAPNVAANVMKRENKYVIAAADKDVKVSINGKAVTGQHELGEGDIVEVAGIKLQFSFQQ